MSHPPPPEASPPTPSPPIVIHDRTAIAGWVFMAVWMGMLALFTWIMGRDGPHPSQPADLQYGVLGLFWLIGIPVTVQALCMPMTRMSVDPAGGVTILRRSVLTREVETFAPGTLSVEVRQGKDDEGDVTWRTTLVAEDGRERLARAGPQRQDQEALAERLRQALAAPLAESAPGA